MKKIKFLLFFAFLFFLAQVLHAEQGKALGHDGPALAIIIYAVLFILYYFTGVVLALVLDFFRKLAFPSFYTGRDPWRGAVAGCGFIFVLMAFVRLLRLGEISGDSLHPAYIFGSLFVEYLAGYSIYHFWKYHRNKVR